MADNLTVKSPGAGAAPRADAPAQPKADKGQQELDRLKKIAKKRVGRDLSDAQLNNIVKRREATKAHKTELKQTKQAFEGAQAKESVGSKKNELQTKAAKTTGAKGVKSAKDGLTAETRKSISSDPDAGPKLPPTTAKATTPEQAKKILGSILECIEVDGEPVDLEKYAKGLKKQPPSKPKGGQALKQQPGKQTPGQRPARGQAPAQQQPGQQLAGQKGVPGRTQQPGQQPVRHQPGQQRAGQKQVPEQPGAKQAGAQPGTKQAGAQPGLARGTAGITGNKADPQTAGQPGTRQAGTQPGTKPTGAQPGLSRGTAGMTGNKAGPGTTPGAPGTLPGAPGSSGATMSRPGPAALATAQAAMGGRTGGTATNRANSSLNAGGGLSAETSFDGMHFNWDGFFSVFLIKSQEDLLEWKKAMRKLRLASLEVELAGHDLAIAMQEMRNKFKRIKAALDLGKEVMSLAKTIDSEIDKKEAGDVGGHDLKKMKENDEELNGLLREPETQESLGRLGLQGRRYFSDEDLNRIEEGAPDADPAIPPNPGLAKKLRELKTQRAFNGGPAGELGMIQAEQQRLRNQAATTTDPDAKQALLDQANGLEPDLRTAQAEFEREMGEIRLDPEKLKALISLRAEHARIARDLGTKTGSASDGALNSRLTDAQEELGAAETELQTAKAAQPPDQAKVDAAQAKVDAATDKRDGAQKLVDARQQERAALMTVQRLDRQLSLARSHHEGYQDHVNGKISELDGKIAASENATERSRLIQERDALISQLPNDMLQQRVDDAQTALDAHQSKYPDIATAPPAERDARRTLEGNLQSAKQAQERGRFHVNLDTTTYRAALDRARTLYGADQPFDNGDVTKARDKAEKLELAYFGETDPTRRAELRGEVDQARQELQVVLREKELTEARADRDRLAGELQALPENDPSRADKQRALLLAERRVRTAEGRMPSSADAPSNAEITQAGTERDRAKTAFDEFVADTQQRDLPPDQAQWEPQDRARYAQLVQEYRDTQRTLDVIKARHDPAATQTKIDGARDDLDVAQAELERLKGVEDVDDDAVAAQETVVNGKRQSVQHLEGIQAAAHNNDIASLRTSANANNAVNGTKENPDLDDPKWMQYVQSGAGFLDQGTAIWDRFLDQGPWVNAVDKAVGSAIGHARKQRKGAHGQMRQVVSQSQGMINQLIQVLGMSRSR